LAKVVAILLSCALVVGIIVVPKPQVAHAESLKEIVIDRIIKDIAKRLMGDPSMSDDDLKDKVQAGVDSGFQEIDEYESTDEMNARISDHCWRVYYWVKHPYSGGAFNDALLPGEYIDEWGNYWNELEVCVRTGYVPRTDSETAIDSE
jgi:hypothetical protein